MGHQHAEYGWIGMNAKSRIHGFEGKVTGVQFNLTHSTQVSIQPPIGADGKIPDAMLFDAHMCDFSGVPFAGLEIEEYDVQLGDQVEDIVTGFLGVCTVIFCGINGCVEIIVVSKHNTYIQNHKRFRVTQPGFVKLDHATGTGGPYGASAVTAVHKRSD